jgi:hypothetical protein
MECGKVREMLAPCLEGAAAPEESTLVRDHLSSCGECAAAAEDLKRTIGLMESLEEVEPPPWLGRKIMACVREEAEKRGGILRRFFYPLYVKVPLEVFATFLIVGLVAYVVKTTTPLFEAAKVTSEEAPVARRGEPSPTAPEKKSTAAGQNRGTGLDAGRGERTENARGDDKEASPDGPAEQPSGEQAKPTGPERLLREREKVGLLRGQADYAQDAGGSLVGSRPEAPAFAAAEGRSFLPQKRSAVARVPAAPAEVDAAAQQVEKLLVDAGACRVTRTSSEAAESVSAELKSDKIHCLVQKLNEIGDTGGPRPGVPGGETVAVRVGVVAETEATK